MQHNKPTENPEEPGIQDQEELQQRVDALMRVEDDRPDEPSSTPEVPGAEPVIEVNQDPPAEPVGEPTATVAAGQEDDPVVDKAVDDIVAHESDELLAAEDEKLAAAFTPQGKAGLKEKIRNSLSNWWHNPRARRLSLIGLLAAILLLAALPPSRYFFLNTAGVRASANLMVLDDSTRQPLKNVRVQLAGQSAQTDSEGWVKLDRLKLGRTELVVEKRAFAEIKRPVTVGWGSNPFGGFNLTPVGVQYTYIVTDFLSGKPVEKAEATSGEASAAADEQGKIVLTVDKDDPEDASVTITANQYRQEKLTLPADNKAEQAIKLAAAQPHTFISRRSGQYDVYKIDVDGKNEAVILKGTGSERADMVLVPHPQKPVVALVSTRDNVRNQDGFLLSSLILIDLSEDGRAVEVAQSEQIQVLGWFGDRLAYVQVAAGASASNPRRHLLLSYEYPNGDRKELATSNYFNDVLAMDGQIYYAPSGAYQPPGSAKLLRVHADGTGQQTILDHEVWNIFRTDYARLSLSVQQDWYDYALGDTQAQKASGPPAALHTRAYVDSPDAQRSLWAEERDGKGTLLAYDVADKKDTVIKSQSGLVSPFRWLSDTTVVYRIHTDQETADYALSLNGGDPVKIRDVTNTGTAAQRFY